MESCSCQCPNLPLNPGFNVVPGSSRHACACRQARALRRSISQSRIEPGVAEHFNDFVRCAECIPWHSSFAVTLPPGPGWHQESLVLVASGAKWSPASLRGCRVPAVPFPRVLWGCAAWEPPKLPWEGWGSSVGGCQPQPPPDLTISPLQNLAPGRCQGWRSQRCRCPSPGRAGGLGTSSGANIVPSVLACIRMCLCVCVCVEILNT